ncbi:hypothetical protein P280DRAFT_521833 [Massarina eburnea CBS 473.64]|uniref:Uncharacterized protein n=1 Tax=Massarina eburnea CBS 473.64 TaxID=1395130 RepID=A0A6A6RQP4_9PLEO|nr:hypothetical protein P280DRAFT_521833 [Massarina eburnea CBS 473.64]
MGWWQRDPTWARTPIHHYARRMLRDHEATLLSRCFSASKVKPASHKDDDDRHTAGMSKLEWAQLKHYEMWKKKIEHDPYKALFGASETMLSGKGKGLSWDWVNQTLPRWMAREMGLDKGEGGKGESTSMDKPKFRTTKFERNSWTAGIDSPSDSRRVREQSTPSQPTEPPPTELSQETAFPSQKLKDTNESAPAEQGTQDRSKDATARETSFIEEFFSDPPPTKRPVARSETPSSEWRQTSIERRASTGRTYVPISDDTTTNRTKLQEEAEKPQIQNEYPSSRPEPRRNLSDDLDSLSAEDVRASMGRIKSPHVDPREARDKLNEEDTTHREDTELHSRILQKLLDDEHVRRHERELRQETEAAQASSTSTTFDNLIKEEAISELPKDDENVSNQHPQVSVLETGLDFMHRWLHAGGNAITQTFFQDPVDVLADQNRLQEGISSDPFFKGIVSGIQKSRRATWQVKFDLEEDIKASKPLIERLTNNEKSVMFAAGIISGSAPAGTKTEKTTEDRVRVLKRDLLATDDEFRKACEAIDGMDTSTPPSEALARRLRIAADVLRKNSKLTRVMIFGLQTHLESAEGQPSHRTRDLAHRLLALQDTQLALVRLVSRRMQNLGVSPAPDKETPAQVQEATTTATAFPEPKMPDSISGFTVNYEASAKTRARKALADAKLASEVSNLKAAMKGLSDDGYSRKPKPVEESLLDTPNPLSHSLFRPFGLPLGSLSMDIGTGVKFATQRKADKKLVDEVKNAYEDVHGTIAVDNQQVPETEVSTETATQHAEKDEKSSDDAQIDVSTKDTSATNVDQAIPIAAEPKDPVPTLDPISTEVAEADCTPSEPVDESSSTSDSTSDTFTAPPKGFTPEYRIYCHDPTTDELILSPYPYDVPSSTTDTIPFHIALTTLSQPSKFIPHLPHGHEVIAASSDMLIMRSTPDARPSERIIEAVRIPTSSSDSQPSEVSEGTAATGEAQGNEWQPGINPIDGTTRLSPTGFVGNSLDVEREFEERRKAAGEHMEKFGSHIADSEGSSVQKQVGRKANQKEEKETEKERTEKDKKQGRVGVGGVAKTAIVAGAWCYVVGVVAELVR